MAVIPPKTFDFIIVGAGIAGTVLASRLYQKNPTLSILLIEAGSDPTKGPLADTVSSAVGAALLRGTEFDWSYETVPQKNLDDRPLYAAGGKGIGGGSIINFGKYFSLFRTQALIRRQECGLEGMPKITKTGQPSSAIDDGAGRGFYHISARRRLARIPVQMKMCMGKMGQSTLLWCQLLGESIL
jgi:hypothetical protein